MKNNISSIIIAIVGIFILLATVSTTFASTIQDAVTITSLSDSTTAEKEITNQGKLEVDPEIIFDFAKTNIFDAKTDEEKISQYKWFKELLPFTWRLRLILYMDKTYPHLRYAIRH